ncbi:Mitogen-activated protein kinase kinase kinase [Dirofilaria immitis]
MIAIYFLLFNFFGSITCRIIINNYDIKNVKNASSKVEVASILNHDNNDDVNDSNNVKKLPLFSQAKQQHQNIKNAKNASSNVEVISESENNDNDDVNDSNNVKKLPPFSQAKQLTGLVAYGIYRPRPYYTPLEKHFRAQKGYDDHYLIRIFEDYDYVILLRFLKIDSIENFVISPPRGANVIIVNQKHFVGGENVIQMIELDKLHETKQKRLLKEKEGKGLIL